MSQTLDLGTGIGLANLAIVIGGFLIQGGRWSAIVRGMQDEIKNLKGEVQEFRYTHAALASVREDVVDLKSAFLKLTETTTQLAVLQTKQALDSSEIQRGRDRLHDIETHVRGLMAWKDGVQFMALGKGIEK